jgi:hypothetical protein
MATHDPLPIRQPVHARPGWLTHTLAAILVLILSAILALTLPRALAASGSAASPALEQADVHLDTSNTTSTGSQEFEVNVAVGTRNDCETPLNPGQYCIRYSVVLDDQPLDAAFGPIPSSAIQMTGSTITLSLNSAHANLHHLRGSGGPLSIIWKLSPGALPVAGHSSTLSPATVDGTVLGHKLAGPILQASVLTTSSR